MITNSIINFQIFTSHFYFNIMSSEQPKATQVVAKDEQVSNDGKLPLNAVHNKRRAFRRKLISYNRTKERHIANLKKIKEKDESVKDKSATVVSFLYFRNLAITYNWINIKEGPKAVIPDKYAKEVKALVGDKIFEAYETAIKGSVKDLEKTLSDDVDVKVIDSVVSYVDKHDKVDVVDILEKTCNDLTEEIEARKDEPRPKRSSSQKKRAKEAKAKKSAKESKKAAAPPAEPEEQFKAMMRGVKDRIAKIKFEKGDFQTYSDVVAQIDVLQAQSNREIANIKNTLKKRFDASQGAAKGRSESQGSRKPRARRPRAKSGEDKSASVFSKDPNQKED